MDDQSQLEFLKAFVLPSDDHDSLRVTFGLTPSDPSPSMRINDPAVPVEGESRLRHSGASDERRVRPEHVPLNSGSEFVSPAIELIRVAKRLGRLEEIRLVIENWKGARVKDRKGRAAMLCAVHAALENFDAADGHLRSLIELAREHPGLDAERHAEAVGLWVAAQHSQLSASADELAVLLFEEIQADRIPRSERWRRLITAKRQSLLAAAEVRNESVTPTNAVNPSQWLPMTRCTAGTRGPGYPSAHWLIQRSSASHTIGHDHDYLCYRSPLFGDFVVEADVTTFALRDLQLGFAGHWAGASWNLTSVVNASFREDLPAVPIEPPLTRMLNTMRVRMEVDDAVRLWINGRHVYTRPLQEDSDPWLTIHSWWLAHGTVSNLRITGEPQVPDTVRMITSDLSGWLSYYDETVGWENADWFVPVSRDVKPGGRTTENAGATGSSTTDSAISGAMADEVFSRIRPDLKGTFSESLLRYHRPMIEDGTITYEFFYEPSKSIVHPALDRLCLILNPEGVDLHWATDGRYDSTDLGPDNLSHEPQYRVSAQPLPLKPAEWNQVALTMKETTVSVKVNGQLVFARPLEATNQRTFGLFHWSDQSEVRVRNLVWTGNWPKSVPPLAKQSMADVLSEAAWGDRNNLKSVLNHNFRDGIPAHLISVIGEDWKANLVQRRDGIQITRPGGHYVNYTLLSPIVLSGDFDLIAEFDQFDTEVEAGGEGNIQLVALVDDEYSSEFYLFRKHYEFDDGRHEQIAQPAIFQKRGDETQYSFFEAPAEEARSGKLRLVRRGTTLFSLMAEGDSENYRLIRREQITQDDARFRFVVGHHKSGFTRVLLRSLDVRAADSWGASGGALKTIDELDDERRQLQARRSWDFRQLGADAVPIQGTNVTNNDWTILSSNLAKYDATAEGLRIEVPGREQWTASGIVSRCQIEGDFDIELQLDTIFLEPSKQYGESGVLLLTEFRDARKTTTEAKFSIHHAGDRKAETQLRRIRRDGKFDYQEFVSLPFDDVAVLRLARRGEIVYQIFRSKAQNEAVVLGATQIGRDPVVSGDLRALVHTAGANRRSTFQFHSLTIQAERIVDPR